MGVDGREHDCKIWQGLSSVTMDTNSSASELYTHTIGYFSLRLFAKLPHVYCRCISAMVAKVYITFSVFQLSFALG